MKPLDYLIILVGLPLFLTAVGRIVWSAWISLPDLFHYWIANWRTPACIAGLLIIAFTALTLFDPTTPHHGD